MIINYKQTKHTNKQNKLNVLKLYETYILINVKYYVNQGNDI